MSVLDAFRLDGRVALVPGGGGAIGTAVSLALAEAGARVAAANHTRESAEACAEDATTTRATPAARPTRGRRTPTPRRSTPPRPCAHRATPRTGRAWTRHREDHYSEFELVEILE